MKKWKLFLTKYCKYFRFIIILAFVGLIVGLLFYIKFDNSLIFDSVVNIKSNLSDHFSYFGRHFLIWAIIIFSCILSIGFIILPIYLILEFASITYSLLIFNNIFGFSGFLWGLIFNLILRLGFLIIILIFSYKFKCFIKNNFKLLDYNYLFKQIKIYFLITLFNDLLIYFLANYILFKLTFIIN